MTEKGVLVDGWLNPLVWSEVDEPWASHTPSPTTENALAFLCTPGLSSSLDALVSRYKEVSQETKRLFAVPDHPEILERIVWPLRNAKASYALGNYLGTIALCGLVAEMLAVLLFDISQKDLLGHPFQPLDEKRLFGNDFERLGQQRRVNVLLAMELIDDSLKDRFDQVRTTRSRYLHFYSRDNAQVDRDAVTVYDATVNLVSTTLIVDLKDGKLRLRDDLMRFLNQEGLVHARAEGSEPKERAP